MKKIIGFTSAALVLAGGTYLVSQGAENNVEVLGASSTQTADTNISLDQAKEIAFDHAQVDGTKALFDDEDLDDDQVWELEFEVADVEYEFDIDAHTGEILDIETDDQDDFDLTQATETPISLDQAKEIAFDHARVDGNKAVFDDEDLDDDHVWELEFEVADVEYEFDIDANTGEILDFEIDGEDQEISNVQASPRHVQNQAPSSVPTQTSGHISSQQAVDIALNDVGVTGEVDVELDDGVWEVEIETATHEYEYEISLIGEILDREVELDD